MEAEGKLPVDKADIALKPAGSSGDADQRGIIIVGGKPQDALPGHLGEKLQTVQPSSLEWAVNLFLKNLQTSQPYEQAEKGITDKADTPEMYYRKEMDKSLEKKQEEIEAKAEELRRKQAFEALKQQPTVEFEPNAEGPMAKALETKQKAFQALKEQTFVEADGNAEGPREKASAVASKDSAGSSSGVDQRGIIIVGGTPQDAASKRGIIIVGGKTDGTYFQTIDDTIRQLQSDPKPDTLQLQTADRGRPGHDIDSRGNGSTAATIRDKLFAWKNSGLKLYL